MSRLVLRGHSRSKNGVASLAYALRIHAEPRQFPQDAGVAPSWHSASIAGSDSVGARDQQCRLKH